MKAAGTFCRYCDRGLPPGATVCPNCGMQVYPIRWAPRGLQVVYSVGRGLTTLSIIALIICGLAVWLYQPAAETGNTYRVLALNGLIFFTLLLLATAPASWAVRRLRPWGRPLAVASLIVLALLILTHSVLTFLGANPLTFAGPMSLILAGIDLLLIALLAWGVWYLNRPDIKQAFSSRATSQS